jgi:RNA polymerase sigma-70 factor, ECF subfamily
MRAYQDMVFSTAARLTGNEAQAEDIAQQAFLKAFENFSHLRTSPTAGGWLKTVVRRLALNHIYRYRKRWRFFSEMSHDGAEDDEIEFDFAAPDDLLGELDSTERFALVEQALTQLPAHQRVPLVLYHFEDLSYADIAKQLGVSLSKVKTDILRARVALAKALSHIGPAPEQEAQSLS